MSVIVGIIIRRGWRNGVLGICLFSSAVALILWPEQVQGSIKEGMSLCSNVIFPSLFPFLILSTLVVELGLSKCLGQLLGPLMRPLFRLNGACSTALVLGFLGGYPVGAQTAIQLYQRGQCSKTEAERMLAFCNNCGPAFVLGVVGGGVFGSGIAGLLLYAAHLLASLLIGILFRFYRPRERPTHTTTFSDPPHSPCVSVAVTRSVTGAARSMLNICSFILAFSVLRAILIRSGLFSLLCIVLTRLFSPFGMDQTWAYRFMTGVLEVSSGIASLTSGSWSGKLSMAAFMLGWAGLSVHCQVLTFLNERTLSVRTYLAGKALHGLLSSLLIRLLTHVTPFTLPASAYLAEQTELVAHQDFQQLLAVSAVSAWVIWLLFLAVAARTVKKGVENTV